MSRQLIMLQHWFDASIRGFLRVSLPHLNRFIFRDITWWSQGHKSFKKSLQRWWSDTRKTTTMSRKKELTGRCFHQRSCCLEWSSISGSCLQQTDGSVQLLQRFGCRTSLFYWEKADISLIFRLPVTYVRTLCYGNAVVVTTRIG